MKHSSRILVSMAVLIGTCVAIVPSASAAALPDLLESALTNPPALTWRGAVIKITDTVKNAGTGTSNASTTRYYLSKDKVFNSGDIRFTAVRKVGILKRGKTSKGTATLTVPATAAGARYYVLACADNLKKVKEKNEKNNCRATAGTTLLDATKPGPPVLSSTPGGPNNSTTPTINASAEANSSVRLFSGAGCTGTLLGTAPAAGGVASFVVPAVTANSTTLYSATATDTAKNASVCSATFSYVNDSDPPGAPTIDTAPPAQSADETPDWTFSGEPNATFECRLTGPAGVDTGFASCSSPKSYDLTDGLTYADGTYTLEVRQIDQAGNAGTATATDDFFLDSTPPGAPEITGGPTGTVTSATLTFVYSDPSETNTEFECKVTRNGVTVSDFAVCGSSPGDQFEQSTLAADDGAVYEFSVRQVDGVGNQSSADTASVTVDRFAPAPTVTGPSDPSNGANPLWDIQGESAATFKCTLSRANPSTTLLTDVDCADDFTHDISGEPDDTYTMSVTQTDIHGNTSAPATAVFTYDRSAPDLPTFGVTRPSDPTNDETPQWAFSGESAATFECALYVGGSPAGAGFDFASCTSTHLYDISSLPDATYTFRVRQTDAAGNPGGAADLAFTLDTELPDAPLFDSTPNTFDNDSNPVWTFSGESQANFNCVLKRGAATIDETGCDSGTYTLDLSDTGTYPDGAYTFSVSQTDAAGNESATSTTDVYNLDRAAPNAPTALAVTPASPSNVNSPTISGAAENGSSVEVFRDAACTTSAATGTSIGGVFSIPVTVTADTTTVFAAKTTDAAGNSSGCSTSTVTYVEDSIAPGLPTAITSTPNGPKNDNAPAVSGSAEAGSLVRIYSDAACTAPAFLGQGTAAGNGTFSVSVSVTDNTSTTFRATATDAAFNTSGCSTANDTYVEDSIAPAAPTFSGTFPASPNSEENPKILGTAEAGSTVKLYKSASCTGVEVAGTAATFQLPGIVVNVPPNNAATIFGTATDEAGNASPCSPTSVLYENLLSEVEPNSTEAQATPVPDLNGDGEPDAVTTWTGLTTLDDVDPDFYKFTLPAGAAVRAETTDRASAATCSLTTDLTLYEEATPGNYVEVAHDDDFDDGLNDCSLIDGSSSSPPDPGASNLDGTYYLKVSSPTVADYRLILTLDAGEFEETEPIGSAGVNDGSATADGPIRNDRVIRGTLSTTSDRDFYRIELTEGAVVRFETFDLGRTEPFDPATADCVARPPQALPLGTSVQWNGAVSHPLQLTHAGSAGIGPCGAVVTWVPAGTSTVLVQRGSAGSLAVGDYAMQVEILDDGGVESESNDTRATADAIAGSDTYVWGDHTTISDVDYWSITVPEGKDLRVELIEGFDVSEATGTGPKEPCEGGGIASKITFVNAAGTDLDVGDDTGRGHSTTFPTRRCSLLDGSGSTAQAPDLSDLPAGTYFIRVEHGSPLSPPAAEAQFVYRLAVTVR